jgi:CRISPR-associated protein Csd2
MKFNFKKLSDIPSIICDRTKRHDVCVLWDATGCNPNGDPDSCNEPRRDEETGRIYATDSSFKRRIRDFIELFRLQEKLENCEIFIRRETFLSETIMKAYKDCGIDFVASKGKGKDKEKSDKKVTLEDKEKANQHICQKYFDVRMLGGVLVAGGGHNAGKVTGPSQVGFSYSVDPVESESIGITRVCGDKNENGDDPDSNKVSQTQTMGRKEIVHYALLKTPVFYNPNIRTEFVSDSDLRLFWFSILKMWDVSKTSSKNLALQTMIVFTHDNPLGDAPTHKLFDLIKIKANKENPRSVHDYDISFNQDDVPEGVTVTVLY